MPVHPRHAAALLAVALAIPGSPARAADAPDTVQLRKQIEELQASLVAVQRKLDQRESAEKAASAARPPETAGVVTQDDLNGVRADLETFKYQYGREREYNTTLSNRPVNVTGTLQARLGYVDKVAPASITVANNRTQASFNNGAAAIQFAGNLYKDYQEGRNLTYVLRAGAAATGGVNLQFASLTYNFLPTLSPEDPRLTLSFGQQILPFGLDVAAPDELKPTISSAQHAGLFPNAIDIGAIARGELGVTYDYGYSYRAPVLAFYAGVVNGSGANRTDDNNKKDLFGRIVFTVPAGYHSWLRQLAIGASAYKGHQNTTLSNAGTTLSGYGRRDRFGVDVYYNHHPFGVTYEYVRGLDGRTYGATSADPKLETVTSEAHVVTVYFTFGEQFLYNQSALGTASIAQGRFDDWWPKSYQPFVRVDLWDPSTEKHDAAHGWNKDAYTAGVNVFFAQTTKFQLNANLIKDHNPASPTPEVRQVLGQFQFGF